MTRAQPIRLVFLGTADFAVPSLRALAAEPAVDVVHVVTQPARPAGRGRSLLPTPVRRAAEELALPVWEPARLRAPDAVEQLARLAPEILVVAAYGQILPPSVLALPRHGSLNVHASLLPRHRGASPVAAAILEGDTETGVTIMLMDAGLDTGPVLAQQREPVQPDDTTGTLTERLANLGARLLVRTLPDWVGGKITPRPQDETRATLTRRLRKEDGAIDWSRPAIAIERQMRAFQPWPGAFCVTPAGERVVIRSARVRQHRDGLSPGQGGMDDGHAVIGTGDGAIEPVEVQPAGRRPMPYADYLRGRRLRPDAVHFSLRL